ncbi:MAG: hypothetical protein R2703_14890 [Micropruina glycogenica]
MIDALAVCWAVLDGPSGKIVRPALPVLVASLVAKGELNATPEVIDALLAMSAATIDRRLRPYRLGLVGNLKGRSLTRPGSLLKSSIPLKTWHEWDDTQPGFIEIDLVGHDGGDNNGHFHYSLTLSTWLPVDRNHHREVQGRKDRGHRAGATRPPVPRSRSWASTLTTSHSALTTITR